MNALSRCLLAATLLIASTIPAAADLKIVTRRSTTGSPRLTVLTETKYVQGPRSRIEYSLNTFGNTQIYQCDARKRIDLNLSGRIFDVTELGPDGFPLDRNIGRIRARMNPGPKFHYTITTEDTGERAKVFGYDAWHVRETTVAETASAAATKTVVDYWFIDLDVPNECYAWKDWTDYYLTNNPQVKVTRIGEAKRGFPVLTRTVRSSGKAGRGEFVVEVKELSAAPLNPQLFEVPKDFQPALKTGGRVFMDKPDTVANRMQAGWDEFWVGLAKFIY